MKAKRPRARAPRRAPSCGLERGALRLGNRRVPLLAGAVHYWRLEREAWRPALSSTRGMGLPIVETYVPWQVHETAPGEHDFGRIDPRKDLGAFLDLAQELEMLAFVRPGPHINSEMTYFGLPERIVYDKACQARSPKQNPVFQGFPPRMFPVPSYVSEQYHQEVGRWFDAVAEVVVPRLWPKGPVALLQVDNECPYWFRDHAYDQDYHPDSIALFRRFLETKYGGLEETSRAHRRSYASWDDVEAPIRFDAEERDALVLHLDWCDYREWALTDSIARMKARMEAAGLKGVPTFHNLPLGEQASPTSLPALEEVVDVVGIDYYHARREHRHIKRRTLHVAGTSVLPFAPEMGAGAPPWFTPLTHEDSHFCAMTACAWGLRGMSLYMAVDRDRWYGAPIDARGNPRVDAGAWKHFFEVLAETRFHELERKAAVGLVMPREYGRLSRATHLLGLLSPITLDAVGGTPVDACSEEDLGFAGPIQILWWKMLARFAEALTLEGVPYVYIDGDAPPERFEGLDVIVAPTFEYCAPARWRKHCAWAAAGGTVVYGPAMPTLDESMQKRPLEVPREGRKVLIDTQADATRVVRELMRDLALPTPFRVTPAPLESTVHEDASGPRVIFVINPGTQDLEACVRLPAPMQVEDVTSAEVFAGGETLTVPMRALTCRMLRVRSTAIEAGARVRAKRSAS